MQLNKGTKSVMAPTANLRYLPTNQTPAAFVGSD